MEEPKGQVSPPVPTEPLPQSFCLGQCTCLAAWQQGSRSFEFPCQRGKVG